jgi:endonuclease/exonuclease/phosphatase family metal-dependent hydrolase
VELLPSGPRGGAGHEGGVPALKRIVLRAAAALLAIAVTLVALFALNGAVIAPRNRPVTGTTTHAPASFPDHGSTVRILAWNIAKLFIHRGGLSFESAATARARLDRIAGIIRGEHPDLVFLEEAVYDCAPCPVNQVTGLAEATGMHFWAFGENYDLGIPFVRLSGGNAILSRWPLEPVGNPDLPGRKPFWVATNNRRFLLCSFPAAGQPVLAGAVHADSFSLAAGAKHLAAILETIGGRPPILAGDFNAEPKDESMRLVRESKLFSGEIGGGAPTHRAPHPTRRIDFALAPHAWEHLGTRVLDSDASDHAAVVADFRVP